MLTPDLPGHGSRRGERYTLQGGIDTVLAAAAQLPPKQVQGLVLAGCSANLRGSTLVPYWLQSALFAVFYLVNTSLAWRPDALEVALFGVLTVCRGKMDARLRAE